MLTAISRHADIEMPDPSICFRAYSLLSLLDNKIINKHLKRLRNTRQGYHSNRRHTYRQRNVSKSHLKLYQLAYKPLASFVYDIKLIDLFSFCSNRATHLDINKKEKKINLFDPNMHINNFCNFLVNQKNDIHVPFYMLIKTTL